MSAMERIVAVSVSVRGVRVDSGEQYYGKRYIYEIVGSGENMVDRHKMR
jgi:hypothetical protein